MALPSLISLSVPSPPISPIVMPILLSVIILFVRVTSESVDEPTVPVSSKMPPVSPLFVIVFLKY